MTAYVPAFLRSSTKVRIERESITTTYAYQNNSSERRTTITEPPFQRKGRGLIENTWYGELDFLWEGSPIRYRRVPVLEHYGEVFITFIAVKDRKAFESFYKALTAFERRLNPPRRFIQVYEESPIERPKLSWEDLILPPGMAADIRGNVESFFKSKSHYKKLGIPYRRGLLFSGPPGNGKTLTARVISSRVPAAVVILPLKAKMDDYSLARAFRHTADIAPALMILEDLDRLPIEGKEVSMSYLLNLLDGFRSTQGIMIIATTNAPEKLDAALLDRPSRFDRVWHFGLPAQAERERLLHKASKGYFSPACLADAAARSTGFTMAYVQEAVISALLKAVTENREPSDADLLASVAKLSSQLRTNSKADGSLKPAISVGFVTPGGNGSHKIPEGMEVRP
jgi:hypothetical protein